MGWLRESLAASGHVYTTAVGPLAILPFFKLSDPMLGRGLSNTPVLKRSRVSASLVLVPLQRVFSLCALVSAHFLASGKNLSGPLVVGTPSTPQLPTSSSWT